MNITVDGYNICYKISGSKDKYAVILQGWGTDLGVYDSMAACINDTYQVVQLDLPGFGASDEPKEAWSVDDYADFLCKFLKALDISEAMLIGHSYGGRMIIKLASRESIPFKISNIILVDSAGIMPKRTLSQKWRVKKYKLLKKIFNIQLVYALFPELIDAWRATQGSADYRNSSPMMRQCMVKAVNEDLTNLLGLIKQDTLLIWGDKDTATPISDARLMEERIKNSGLAVIPGTGHFCFLEQPSVFRNIMRAYIASIK